MKKSLILLALGASLFGQPPRPGSVATQHWWDSRLSLSIPDLTEAQTKQLNAIQAAYVGRLMDLNAAVTKADTNLDEVFKQSPADELKAEAAIDQYASARENLTRELTRLSLKMRNVLTAEQWQELLAREPGRGGPRGGRGGGRRGTGPGGPVNKSSGSAVPQK